MENYAVVSLYGLAPYQFKIDGSLMLNEDGDLNFSLEAEYEIRTTQTTFIQPRLSLSGLEVKTGFVLVSCSASLILKTMNS
ncbi:hypothetical protein GCM10009114_01130 [Aliiglaciecola litoralis]|uniref:Uncharacterized protein n=2 Tax=Aliiglaciecola litoralis TaxID=582857 RepID=A0ABN1LBW3_9ALTE